MRAFGYHNQDLSFIKNTRLGGSTNVQFRFEIFNLWNWHMFSNPGEWGALAFNNDIVESGLREVERIGHRATHDADSGALRVLSRSRQRGAIQPVPGSVAPLSSHVLTRPSPHLLDSRCADGHGGGETGPRRRRSRCRFTEGVTALKSGDLKTAERAFRDVVANGGERPFVHHNLGIVLQQRGEHQAALAEFRAAERLDPAFGPAWLLAGVSLLALGRPRDAVTELDRAAELLPGEAAVHLQLADAFERTGNITGVVREYRRLVELGPSNEDYLYRLGKAYLRLAQQSYERLRAVAPRSARLSQALGDRVPRTEPAGDGARCLRAGGAHRSLPAGRSPRSCPDSLR